MLNSVMAAAPQHVTGTYLLPALQHYTHLLAPSQRARSVKAGSIKSLLEVQPPWSLTSEQGRLSPTCEDVCSNIDHLSQRLTQKYLLPA